MPLGRVCVFVLLLVSLCPSFFLWLVGWLFAGIWFFFFVWLLGAPSGMFFCTLAVFFMCVLHLWRPWASIVAPGAPF